MKTEIIKKKVTALIVDDEKLARDYIKDLLKKHPQIEVLGEATNGLDAIERISTLEPDIVFLDIQMPIKNGIEVVQAINQDYQPIYIFVTAYDEYAITAFDNNAIDYLLKPFDQNRFDKSIVKTLRLFSNIQLKENYNILLQLLSSNYLSDTKTGESSQAPLHKYISRLPIKTQSKTELINVEEIRWIQSDAYLLNIYSLDKRYVITGKLKEIESQLDPTLFVRIHRSIIVNIKQIKAFRSTGTGSYEVFLDDNTKLKLSRRRKEIIDRLISKVT